ncbi:tripartite motif-containing protein 45-like isoform X3 [Mya arenaria]|uniref:tripartite motif-containing protein 45-like isoform X3 n=1 Tax=Mya arenaria TaxID=6604 RepID=UPI0022E1A2ED|nr:tripartite motif-containing protein 45-like isoform X3 [Mya arenaria]
MEVSGKKIQTDASVLDTTFCQPCSQEGETLPAEAYCTVCREFMCSVCTNVHKKQKMSKFHALLDKSSMPTAMQGESDAPQSTEACNIHPEELIKYFCPTHQSLNCGHCLAKEHRTCHVDIISEISRGFKDHKEYADISKAISELSKALQHCAEEVETKLNLIKELAEDEVSNLREYRDKINTYFDDRENALLKFIEEMKSIDETRIHSIKPRCDDLKAKVDEMKCKLAEQERNNTQLFIEVKRAQKHIEILQSGLDDINKEMTFHRYTLRKDPAMERMLSSKTGLGTVHEEDKTDLGRYPQEQNEPEAMQKENEHWINKRQNDKEICKTQNEESKHRGYESCQKQMEEICVMSQAESKHRGYEPCQKQMEEICVMPQAESKHRGYESYQKQMEEICVMPQAESKHRGYESCQKQMEEICVMPQAESKHRGYESCQKQIEEICIMPQAESKHRGYESYQKQMEEICVMPQAESKHRGYESCQKQMEEICIMPHAARSKRRNRMRKFNGD